MQRLRRKVDEARPTHVKLYRSGIGERDGRTNSKWSLRKVQNDSMVLRLLGGIRPRGLWAGFCVRIDLAGSSRRLLQLPRPERIRHHASNGVAPAVIAQSRNALPPVSSAFAGLDSWHHLKVEV
jgi:hypothetical protein